MSKLFTRLETDSARPALDAADEPEVLALGLQRTLLRRAADEASGRRT